MKLYKIKTKLHTHTWWDNEPRPEPKIVERYYCVDNDVDIKDSVFRYHGCWNEVEILSIKAIKDDDFYCWIDDVIEKEAKQLLINYHTKQIHKLS